MALYLDYNASAPLLPEALDAMLDVWRNHIGNADSRTHIYGTEAKEIVSHARQSIADTLAVDPMDVIFTSGSTESSNMAILGMLEYARETGRNHFITTSMEHKSVLESMRFLQKHGCDVDFVSPDRSGRIRPAQVLDLVTDRTLLVSVMHVNSETGIIQPVEEIGRALAPTQVYFHSDATQGYGKRNDTLRTMPYDMLSITAHKVGGPQGIGALILRRDRRYQRPPIRPLLYGGPQERGYRPGTTPVALTAGFAAAARFTDRNAARAEQACLRTRTLLLDAIQGLSFSLNGDPAFALPSTVNISFHGVDAESLFVALKEDYAFSNGSACNSGTHAPSYVLTAMGLPEERIAEAVRISWGPDTKPDFSALADCIRALTE